MLKMLKMLKTLDSQLSETPEIIKNVLLTTVDLGNDLRGILHVFRNIMMKTLKTMVIRIFMIWSNRPHAWGVLKMLKMLKILSMHFVLLTGMFSKLCFSIFSTFSIFSILTLTVFYIASGTTSSIEILLVLGPC